MNKQEEPSEARVLSTVPWEREGEIPLRDPISTNTVRNPLENRNYINHLKHDVPIMKFQVV